MAEKLLFALVGAVVGLSSGYFLGSRTNNTPAEIEAPIAAQCASPQISTGANSKEPVKNSAQVAGAVEATPGGSSTTPISSTPLTGANERSEKPEASVERNQQVGTTPSIDLENVRNETEVKEFLKSSEIKDLYRSIPDSLPIANRRGELEFLNGRFVGVAQVVNETRNETWDVSLLLDGKMVNGKLSGNEEIILSVNGRAFSKKSGNGTLKSFRELPGDEKMVLIETGPNTYLQLYYLKSSDMFIGNVYRPNEGQPKLIPVGTVQLYRR